MLKFPKMPYWPYSPGAPRDGDELAEAARFVGRPVVVTEKLDGGNTLLFRGRVYARSVAAPAPGKWMAMVKKHHAWKVTEPDVLLYGEDIYGVHSIEYDAVPEHETFYAFALRRDDGCFASFQALMTYAGKRVSRWSRFCLRGRSRRPPTCATSWAGRTARRRRWAARGKEW